MTQCYDSLSSNHTNPPISSMLTTSMSIFTLADTEPSAGNIFVTGHLGASCLPPRRTSENVRLLKRLKEGGDELDSMDAHRGHLVVPVLVEQVAGVFRYQSCSWYPLLWQRNKLPVITHTPAWVRHDWVNR